MFVMDKFLGWWLVKAFHIVGLLLVRISSLSKPLLRPGWRQVLLYKCVQRLLNRLRVLHNWSKHSARTTSLKENAIGRSILLGSKNLRKGGDLIFLFKGDLLFWRFLIRWKMSRLEHFRRFPMALIQSRRMWAGSYRFFILFVMLLLML